MGGVLAATPEAVLAFVRDLAAALVEHHAIEENLHRMLESLGGTAPARLGDEALTLGGEISRLCRMNLCHEDRRIFPLIDALADGGPRRMLGALAGDWDLSARREDTPPRRGVG